MNKIVFNSPHHATRFLERNSPDLARRIDGKKHFVAVGRKWTEEEQSAFNFLEKHKKIALSRTGYYLLS